MADSLVTRTLTIDDRDEAVTLFGARALCAALTRSA